VALGALAALAALALALWTLRGRLEYLVGRLRDSALPGEDELVSCHKDDRAAALVTEGRAPRRLGGTARGRADSAGGVSPPQRKGGHQDEVSHASTQLPGSPEVA